MSVQTAPSAARRLLVPAVSTVLMLAVLIGLGTWQIQRMHWKRGILDQIAQAESLPAVPLVGAPAPFAKLRLEGHFRDDLAALYAAEGRDTRSGPQMGAHLIEPMERDGADPVLVDRGWVPSGWRPSAAPGRSSVEGFAFAAQHPGMFSATDDLPGRHFYTLDPQRIGAALGLARVAPFTLVAMGPPAPDGLPDPARKMPRPPNDHLSYAVTWYGLAVTLLVIFTVYVRKVLRP